MTQSLDRLVFKPEDHENLDRIFSEHKKVITPEMSQNEIMYNAGMKHVLDVLKERWTAWNPQHMVP